MAILATKTMDYPYKHPDSKEAYDLDIVNWLASGETILSATVTRTGPDNSLTLVGTPIISGSRIKQWVEGGTNGEDYILDYEAVTSLDYEHRAQLIIPVRKA
jgi:hypothetical protein